MTQEELKRLHVFSQMDSIKSNAQYEQSILISLMMDKDLINIEPLTQKRFDHEKGKYFLDLFYPELKFNVEIDEGKHEYTVDEDAERDEFLKDNHEITVHRIRFWGDQKEVPIWTKIDECKKEILKKYDVLKPNDWWLKQHELEQAKNDHDNTLFFKTNKPIFNDGVLDFNLKIRKDVVEGVNDDCLNICVYTGDTNTIAQVITVPVDQLTSLGGGMYGVSNGAYVNDTHSLNLSGSTIQNWERGKEVQYSNNLYKQFISGSLD